MSIGLMVSTAGAASGSMLVTSRIMQVKYLIFSNIYALDILNTWLVKMTMIDFCYILNHLDRHIDLYYIDFNHSL